MEKPEQMFWPTQYTEYNIEEKIVIMLENVHFFYPHDYLCIFYKHSNQKVNTIANTEMYSISTKARTGMIQTNCRIIVMPGKREMNPT